MIEFLRKNRAEVLKLIVVLLPMLGLGGLAIEQQKELQELRTTVVVEHEPIEVIVEKNEHTYPVHNHKHTHPEFKQLWDEIERWH